MTSTSDNVWLISLLPGKARDIPVRMSHSMRAPRPLLKRTPMVNMNCIKLPRAPRMETSAVSEMYNGAARENAPPPKPAHNNGPFYGCIDSLFYVS